MTETQFQAVAEKEVFIDPDLAGSGMLVSTDTPL